MNKKVKVKGEGEGLKRVTLNRNGQTCAKEFETSELKAGRFVRGQRVMLRITGDCCYHSSEYAEYEVVGIRPCFSFGGSRETVTFKRVEKGGAK